MKVVDIDAKEHEFTHEDVSWVVYSQRSFKDPNVYIVRLLGPADVEIAVEALTRGEGMVILADMLKSLGYRLAREALEQEGTYRNPFYKERTR